MGKCCIIKALSWKFNGTKSTWKKKSSATPFGDITTDHWANAFQSPNTNFLNVDGGNTFVNKLDTLSLENLLNIGICYSSKTYVYKRILDKYSFFLLFPLM